MDFVLQSSADAAPGEGVVKVRASAEKGRSAATDFRFTVQGLAFTLRAEPQQVKLVYGRTAKVKISVSRMDYQGPIQLTLDPLPPQVKANPFTLPAQQSSGEIESSATGEAASLEKTVQIRGTSADNRQAQATFDLKVEGKPFTLQVPMPGSTWCRAARPC